jgi:hypothetical protein
LDSWRFGFEEVIEYARRGLLNMQSASVEEVNIYLNDILAQIELGKDVVITRLGQPIARLSPYSYFKSLNRR